MIAHDSDARSYGPECGSAQLECTERFDAAVTRLIDARAFDPESLREATIACANEGMLRAIPVERLIAELGDCLRLRPLPQKQYAELRQLVVGWILEVYFPPA